MSDSFCKNVIAKDFHHAMFGKNKRNVMSEFALGPYPVWSLW